MHKGACPVRESRIPGDVFARIQFRVLQCQLFKSLPGDWIRATAGTIVHPHFSGPEIQTFYKRNALGTCMCLDHKLELDRMPSGSQNCIHHRIHRNDIHFEFFVTKD